MNLIEMLLNENIDPNKIDVIAFDIFDTILYRKTSPLHVHRTWAKKIIVELGLSISHKRLVQLKFLAARIIKLKNKCLGHDKEYQYDEMLRVLYYLIHLNIDFVTFKTLCRKIELEVETEHTYIPDESFNRINNAISLGKKVICISDYYLDASFLSALFKEKSLSISNIYVSCDYLAFKSTGNLYKKVINDLKVEANKIVMIGDTYKSDYINARQKGIKAIHIMNEQRTMEQEYEKEIKNKEKKWVNFINGKEKAPFKAVSYLMYIFIDRLYKALSNDNCQNVLFMSREGELFKKLFDAYQDICIPEEKKIKSHYFYISRKATLLPSIFEIKEESFKEIYKNYPNIKLNDFLKNLDLDKNKNIRKEFNHILDSNSTIKDFGNSDVFKRVLSSEVFKRECLQVAKEQRNLFLNYINAFNINYEADGLYLVDVGYSGTSQNNIYNILKRQTTLRGYYMICNDEASIENNIKKGIIYDQKSRSNKNIFTYNSAVIEMLSLASHCGVDSYYSKEGVTLPVFHNNEQELYCYKNVIAPIQNNILNYFRELVSLTKDAQLDENYYIPIFKTFYRKFIFNPTIEEIEKYLTIPFVDNFAIFREYKVDGNTIKHNSFSFHGMYLLLKTKFRCLKEQNTHWIAAAMYKINMGCLNPVMAYFSTSIMRAFDEISKMEQNKKKYKL